MEEAKVERLFFTKFSALIRDSVPFRSAMSYNPWSSSSLLDALEALFSREEVKLAVFQLS